MTIVSQKVTTIEIIDKFLHIQLINTIVIFTLIQMENRYFAPN